jgi:hypothetical protein
VDRPATPVTAADTAAIRSPGLVSGRHAGSRGVGSAARLNQIGVSTVGRTPDAPSSHPQVRITWRSGRPQLRQRAADRRQPIPAGLRTTGHVRRDHHRTAVSAECMAALCAAQPFRLRAPVPQAARREAGCGGGYAADGAGCAR